METDSQYAYWAQALRTGRAIVSGECANGDFVRSGFFKRNVGPNVIEAIAFWRDETGKLYCRRTHPFFSFGSEMSEPDIEDLYASVSRYPIPHEVYKAAHSMNYIWPEEFHTRLTLSEIKQGLSWTPELGKKKLGVHGFEDIDTWISADHDNPRAVIGNNHPPVEGHELARLTLFDKIDRISKKFTDWINKIGGAAQTRDDALIAGNFANKFKDYENEANVFHADEKLPHWERCKEIDRKWFEPVRDIAIANRAQALKIYRDFEQKNQIKIGTARGGKRERKSLIADLGVFLSYCAMLEEPPKGIIDEAEKEAKRLHAVNITVPGMVGYK